MNDQPFYCRYCGERQRPGARFCKACGKPLAATGATAVQRGSTSPEKSIPPPIPAGKRIESQLTSAIGNAARSAGKAAMQAAVAGAPWQVVVGKQLPPNAIQNILKSAGQAALRSAGQSLKSGAAQLGASLFGPAMFSFLFTFAASITPLLTGGDFSPAAIIAKLVLGIVNLMAGAVASKRRGAASIIMLIANIGLALLQGGTLLGTLLKALLNPTMLGGLLPEGFTQGLSVMAALNAGIKCLRK